MCPICHSHFQEPKILPCFYHYCKKCIQALASSSLEIELVSTNPSPALSVEAMFFFPGMTQINFRLPFFVNRLKCQDVTTYGSQRLFCVIQMYVDVVGAGWGVWRGGSRCTTAHTVKIEGYYNFRLFHPMKRTVTTPTLMYCHTCLTGSAFGAQFSWCVCLPYCEFLSSFFFWGGGGGVISPTTPFNTPVNGTS